MADDRDRNAVVETAAGIAIVLLATMLGICNVKDGNIVQTMQVTKAKEINTYAWFQARQLRSELALSTAELLTAPLPGDTPESQKARKALADKYSDHSKKQEAKMTGQLEAAADLEMEYNVLNKQDDQFDLCEASLAIALALFGVTILLKRWWMFIIALFPAALGVYMGLAGFIGWETKNLPVINKLIELLT